jgi:hypothetical protein
MKLIKSFFGGIVRIPTEQIKLDAVEIFKDPLSNRCRVNEGAAAVERHLSATILHYFMGESHERRDAFESMILNSNWCSFESKRKLIKHIIQELNLLEGEEANQFEKLVANVMKFRNAFTHGQFLFDPPDYWLKYFEGTPQKVQLSDEYLTRVEETLIAATNASHRLWEKIREKTSQQ